MTTRTNQSDLFNSHSSRMGRLDSLSDYILLHIFEYLDVISLTRAQCASRHTFLASYRVLSNSPSIVTESGIGPHSIRKVLAKLTSTPKFAIIIGERASQKLSNFVSALQRDLPKSTHVVLAKCANVLKPNLQLTSNPSNKQQRKRSSSDLAPSAEDGQSEAGDYTVFMAALPDTQCSSFYVKVSDSDPPVITDETLRAYGLQDVDQDWELFLVFASPIHVIEEFISSLQLRYPRAVIVGGVCHKQVALFQYHQFRVDTNCIACLAVRGRVPVRAIVSRGHEAASPVFNLVPGGVNTAIEGQYNFLQVTGMTASGHTTVLNPSTVMRDIIASNHDDAQIFMIGTRYDEHSDIASSLPQQKTQNTEQQQQQQQQQQHGSQSGFHLQLVTEQTWQRRSINFAVEARLPLPNQLRFFIVNSDTCARDMEQSMTLAKQRFAAEGQTVLGTVMFTCSGRGPHRMFFGKSDFDATMYQSVFPDSPLLGCYVDGEIGPQLLGDADRNETLFASSSTQSSVQGFTAVFCLFAVPPRRSINEMMQSLQPLVDQARSQLQWSRQRAASLSSQSVDTRPGTSSGDQGGCKQVEMRGSDCIASLQLASVQEEEESLLVQSILRTMRSRSSRARSRANSLASTGSKGH